MTLTVRIKAATSRHYPPFSYAVRNGLSGQCPFLSLFCMPVEQGTRVHDMALHQLWLVTWFLYGDAFGLGNAIVLRNNGTPFLSDVILIVFRWSSPAKSWWRLGVFNSILIIFYEYYVIPCFHDWVLGSICCFYQQAHFLLVFMLCIHPFLLGFAFGSSYHIQSMVLTVFLTYHFVLDCLSFILVFMLYPVLFWVILSYDTTYKVYSCTWYSQFFLLNILFWIILALVSR